MKDLTKDFKYYYDGIDILRELKLIQTIKLVKVLKKGNQLTSNPGITLNLKI